MIKIVVVMLCHLAGYADGHLSGNGVNIVKRSLPKEVYVSPETFMTTAEIITNRGYPAEIHRVVTEDGYVLQLTRIPYSPKDSKRGSNKMPIFLHHGIILSDSAWVTNPTEMALGYVLADKGYDVWMANARGNSYSKDHIYFDDDDEKFWDFGWDEVGRYDVPASINYILLKTGRDKLSYIGHSMGCGVFFIAMLTHPELQGKVEMMAALAPATSMANMRNILRRVAPFNDEFMHLMDKFGVRRVFTSEGILGKLVQSTCLRSVAGAKVCRKMAFMLSGSNPEGLGLELVPLLSKHAASGTGVKSLEHLLQNYNSGHQFSAYDYGRQGNLARYGQGTAPAYNLNRVSVPVYLFWADNDIMVPPEDVVWLASQLGNVRKSIHINDPMFTHIGFFWNSRARQLFIDRLLPILPPPYVS